jgi:exodeoxyribonuclease V gamma subunit
MHLNIHWSDQFEHLATALYAGRQRSEDPFDTECTVVGSPVMAGWLKQFYLYDLLKTQKHQPVLAGWDFKMLHPFVNDWVAKTSTNTDIGSRNPAIHPYSTGVLQWRIWNVITDTPNDPTFDILHNYIGHDENARHRRLWGLTQQLAQLFDDYQNYRPDLLDDWQEGRPTGLDPNQRWQAVLWQKLTQANPDAYPALFRELEGRLLNCGITDRYTRISIFHTSTMPKAYLQFFAELGRIMPVDLYIFNPSREFWIEDPSVKQFLKALTKSYEDLAWLEPPHRLLSGFGRGTQALLATIIDIEALQAAEIVDHTDAWGHDNDDTLLHRIQQDIRCRQSEQTTPFIHNPQAPDNSVQFHACHSPLREVEVVKDLILKWFDEHADSTPQPRDVQVLVPDMDTYAPFIESVFRVSDVNPVLPCSISNRPAASVGTIGTAFVKLMQLDESRMTAPELIEFLELEPVRERYGLGPEHISDIRSLVNTANIRWGRDKAHINQLINGQSEQEPATDIPDTVTWRRGLDRLIAGFVMGRCGSGSMIQAGELGALCMVDDVEGERASLVGVLAQFYEALCISIRDLSQRARPVSQWTRCFQDMLERFFRGTENSFRELTEIRRAITTVAKTAGGAADPTVPAAIVASAIEAELAGVAPAGKSDTNAVLFSPMRTMQVTPRQLIIMLGVNEGSFPRDDKRTAFDLLATKPRYGDRSLRYADRLAFLEAIMSARDRLIITFTGRNINNDKEVPPSPAVTEFLQYLQTGVDGDGNELIIQHKLHGFNPAYYSPDSQYFSYSRANYTAARNLAGQPDADAMPAPTFPFTRSNTGHEDVSDISLYDLQAFFNNPADFFYTRMLDIRLLDPGRDRVQDSEIFDGGTLDDYQLNQTVIDTIVTRGESDTSTFEPDEAYFQRLQEQAIIPLGTYGRGKARQQIADIRTFLNTQQIPGTHANVLRVLQRRNSTPPTPVSTTCRDLTVSATLPIIEHPDQPTHALLLCFRYATIKPKDRTNAWLSHLIGHAAGLAFETVIAGKHSNKFETLYPLGRDQALQTLDAILERYQKGHDTLIPYAPAASFAYAESIATQDSGSTPNTQAALEAADSVWRGGLFPECNNRHLFTAWREEGPMSDGEFGTVANTFWRPFFEAQQPQTATPTAKDQA